MGYGRSRLWVVATLAMALAGAGIPAPAAPIQEDWAAKAFGASPIGPGSVTAADLLALRDLGALSLSPDGRWVAFALRQADVPADAYQIRWCIAPSDGSAAPRVLDFDGGSPIWAQSSRLPIGYALPEPAKWSPDGRWLALRRRVGTRIELWRITVATGQAQRIAGQAAQVDTFAWTASGLTYRTGLNPQRHAEQVAAEAAHGWLLDRRMAALWAARTPSPLPPDCRAEPHDTACEVETWTVAPDGSVARAAASDAAGLDNRGAIGMSTALRRLTATPQANVQRPLHAWGELVDPRKAKSYYPLLRLTTDAPGAHACAAAACTGQFFDGLGFARDGAAAWFLRRESSIGDEDRGPLDELALYEWRFATGKVRRILRGDLRLEDCHATGVRLICRQSAARQPPRLVAVSLDDGRLRVIADPNPAFATKRFPTIRRLVLRDPEGAGGFAHLVYPAGFRPGVRYPLVVVNYRSSGFLRGGVSGEEYPIFPLAAAGMFVLSVDIPNDLRGARTLDRVADDLHRREGHREVRNIVAAITATVDALSSEGLVDRDRVAITGLSYGAEIVHAALRGPERFAAAIASQGAADVTYFAQFPADQERDAWMRIHSAEGLVAGPGSELYATAWSQHPERLRAPLLLNLGQNEALFGFEGLATLQAAGRPLEVRIFPGEGHIKAHPRSFAGVYDNNVAWLRFWLLDQEDPRPELREQYRRWREMRARLAAGGGLGR